MAEKQFQPCNYQMSVYHGSDVSQIILISQYLLLAAFLLVQMCRLCTKVFSYHKFHIHEAYRFYTIAFVSCTLIIIHRVTQLKLNDYMNSKKPDINVIYGYRIMNELTGIVSVSVTNIMYVVLAFTWLNIAWGCDFNIKEDSVTDTFQSIDQQPIQNAFQSQSGVQSKKQSLKKQIRWGKNISFYVVYPVLLIFGVYGTLDRGQTMCSLALADLLISTEYGYIILTYAFVLYLKKRITDPQTPIYTKVIIIYLIFATTMRVTWFNVIAITNTQQHQYEALQLVYNTIISICPILGLSWLSQNQLSKEGNLLIKSQRVMLMQSTII